MSEDGWRREGPAYDSPQQRRARLRRRGLERSERLHHGGVLDLMSAAVVLVGLWFLPSVGLDSDHAVDDLGQTLLLVAAAVFLVRGLVRMGTWLLQG